MISYLFTRLRAPAVVGTPRLGGHLNAVSMGIGLSLLWYFVNDMHRIANLYDEGCEVTGAAWILRGEVPFRDFWAIYASGQHYVFAALFSVFGPSLIVARLWDVAMRWGCSWVFYRLGCALMPRPLAQVLWVTVGLAVVPALSFFDIPMFPAVFALGTSLLCVTQYIRVAQRWWLLASGVACGAALLFRHDMGAVGVVVVGGCLTWATLRPSGGSGGLRAWPGRAALWVAGAGLLAGPLAAYLLATVPGPLLWRGLVVSPLLAGSAFQILLPPLAVWQAPSVAEWIWTYFPLIMAAASTVWLLRRVAAAGWRADRAAIATTGLIGFSTLLFYQTRNLDEPMHRLPTLLPALVLLYASIGALWRHLTQRWQRRVIAVTGGVAFVLFAMTYLVLEQAILGGAVQQAAPPTLARAGGVPLAADQLQAVAFIQQHTTRDTPLYVGLRTHTLVIWNDALFYFLTDRPNATPYLVLQPTIMTSRPIQQEMITDIRRLRVPYVVLWGGGESFPDNWVKTPPSTVTLLDDFIHQQYQETAVFGAYAIWARAPGPLRLSP